MFGEHVLDGGGRPGHLEADVEALRHAERLLRLAQRPARRDVDDEVRAGRLGQREPLRREVRDADPARSRVPHDGGRHDTDRTGARDDHVLADDWPLQGRVHRVPERVEEGAELRVEVRLLDPGVGGGDDDVVREGTVTVDADADRVVAEVAPAGAAVPAEAADHVALPGDAVAHGDVVDVGPHLHHLAEELVADGHRHPHLLGRPLVPLLEVEVRAAQAGPQHPHLDVLVTALRLGNLHELETRTRRDLPECAHPSHHAAPPAERAGPEHGGTRALRSPSHRSPLTARRATPRRSPHCEAPHIAPSPRPPERPVTTLHTGTGIRPALGRAGPQGPDIRPWR